jgi:meso-butanediol dehydrogenase/(S,S)-butanediol dehydrogenase/diacetyl reductase
VKNWIDEAARTHGGIDVLYNNAGATHFDPIEEESYEDWRFTLHNELDIVFLACKHAWPHLRARGGGASSTSDRRPALPAR